MYNHLYKISWLFIVAPVLAGCVKEVEEPMAEVQGEELHEIVLHAGWAPETRTVLQEDGTVYWLPDDEIGIQYFDNDGSSLIMSFKSINTEPSPVAEFVGCYSVADFPNGATFYAGYPLQNPIQGNYWHDSVSFGAYIPKVQTARENSYDPNAFVSYAKTMDRNLYFRNLCGGVKFSVSQEGIKEVSFRYLKAVIDYGDERTMSGSLVYNFEDYENPYVWAVGGRSNEVIVRAPNDSYFEVGKYYYAVMYPAEDVSIVVIYKKDSTQASYTVKGPVSVKRSVFKRLYEKDRDLIFKYHKDSDGADIIFNRPDAFDPSIDISSIKEVYFHPSSNHITEINLGTEDAPVYFELDNYIAHYYTSKSSFNIKNVASWMFFGWKSLTKIDFSGVDTSEAINMSHMFSGCKSLETLDLSSFNTYCVYNMCGMFSDCSSLRELNLSSFDTSNCINMDGMFSGCRNLRDLNLSSFNTRNCTDMSWIFNNCTSMQKLDLANFDMASVTDISYMCNSLAIKRKQCVVRAPDSVWSRMCSSDAQMPKTSMYYFINRISPDEEFPVLEDKYAGLYKSTDYSKDYTYRTVQTATKGKGIDLVLMGDAYTDRLIDDGKYDRDIEKVIGHIFSEEPLKSLKDYFNIYITYAVSENEEIDGITAFSLVFNDFSTKIDAAFDGTIDDYMSATIPNYGHEWMTGRPVPYIIIISNCNLPAGTTYFFTSGSSVVLMTLENDEDCLQAIACHEFGHALGKLGDEYYQDDLTFNDINDFNEKEEAGFWPNLDITNDPSTVKWSRFLSDERYAGQGLGVYEGGYGGYAYGIWRPTENSLMNNALSGFNAPCREALYKVVNTLADESFVYDYETFVEFDQNAMSSSVKSTRSLNYVERTAQPLPPPVFVEVDPNIRGASTTGRSR